MKLIVPSRSPTNPASDYVVLPACNSSVVRFNKTGQLSPRNLVDANHPSPRNVADSGRQSSKNSVVTGHPSPSGLGKTDHSSPKDFIKPADQLSPSTKQRRNCPTFEPTCNGSPKVPSDSEGKDSTGKPPAVTDLAVAEHMTPNLKREKTDHNYC